MPSISSPARFIAALLVLAVAFGFYNHYRKSSPHEAPVGLVAIGEIVAVNGAVEHRWPARIEILPVVPGSAFHAGELVITHSNSQAVLAFKNGAQLRVLPDSQVVAELDATHEDAIRATVVSGNASITKPGSGGSFRLFREGRDVTEGEAKTKLEIPATGSAPVVAPALHTKDVVTATTPAETPTPGAMENPKAATPIEIGSVPTNDEIRRTFGKNAGFFQRCYLTHLSRKGASDAHSVTVGFTIQPTGKISAVKLVRSDFQDATLNNCVIETIGRTSFRPFKGEPIPVLEFPVELK